MKNFFLSYRIVQYALNAGRNYSSQTWSQRGKRLGWTSLKVWLRSIVLTRSNLPSNSWSILSVLAICSPNMSAAYVMSVAFFVLSQSALTPFKMSGLSMLPTLAYSGEVVVENRLTYQLFPNDLSRGDLITLISPLDSSRIVCKRLLGLPGDIMCIDPTGVHADPSEHIRVPKGHVWVIGDNASHSRDSRVYGPVPMALIRGKLFARVSNRASLGI
jgi:mitochondrial inner membrane protease subunit 1